MNQWNLLVLVPLTLLVSVLATHFFAFVYCHLMAFSLFSAGHERMVLICLIKVCYYNIFP